MSVSAGEDLLSQIGRQFPIAGKPETPATDLRVMTPEQLVRQAVSFRRACQSARTRGELFGGELRKIHRRADVRCLAPIVTEKWRGPISA